MADTATTLAKLIEDLAAERAEYVAAIEQIDAVFAEYGIDPQAGSPAPARRGKKAAKKAAKKAGRKKAARKAAAKKAGRKKTAKKAKKAAGKKTGRQGRGTFPISGEESVLNFVQKAGTPNAKEVNEHWQNEGRKGKADNALTKLVKEGKLQRVSNPGERGGRYKVA